MSYYKAETVREAASGNWLFIVSALAPHAEEALKRLGKHVACPIHGGKDGFRLFKKNFLETGGGICNTCGPRHDGFELLMWLNNWSFKETLAAVGEFLGVEKQLTWEEKKQQQNKVRPQQRQTQAACAVAGAARESVIPIPAQPHVQQEPEPMQDGAASEDSKVIPLLMQKSKPWLMELQEDMERRAERQRKYSARLHEKITQIWEKECLPLSSECNEPVRAYFQNRGLVFRWNRIEESDSLRVHPALSYFDEDGNEVGKFPALVCAIRDKAGQVITLHRIYLTQTGKKARVPEPKKMMPVPDDLTVTGGAIRLGEPKSGIIGVAEGVETALSAFKATQIPTWATVSATLMEAFEVPEGVHTVLIWADKDKSLTGQTSAHALEARLKQEGIKATVITPKLPIPKNGKGVDWNDVLISQGTEGFPTAQRIYASLFGGFAYARA
ncbi:primase-helicase-like zinc-binding protein [Marinobacter nauticus]|uniref:Primase-helicase-like zinc-binding protein n=1 Tax=Marinobacter nauticus TaxID=2743 RepID=A0A368X5N8_MARNT|nr:toprim domain-containing protein [Marinobacter nauticus]RCW63332.1 primase-helicase-like zinc-binding protein [Marinobacter nauticus]